MAKSRFEVYTDGSYNKEKGEVYAAFIILDSGNPVMMCRISTKDKRFSTQWNVGGELLAAAAGIVNALNYLKEARAEDSCDDTFITVYHDYVGVHYFILPPKPNKKPWKPKAKDGAGEYYKMMVDMVLEQSYPLKLKFEKVTSHTGDYWNEFADKIAGGFITEYNGMEVIQKTI